MQTLEAIQRRLHTAQDLLGVAKTMKALAAVNIRQYEEALASLVDYSRAVEMGLQVVLHRNPNQPVALQTARRHQLGAVVFGSDQGMCGQLNDQIVTFAGSELAKSETKVSKVLAIGVRAGTRLDDLGFDVQSGPSLPSSIEGVASAVLEMVVLIESWVHQGEADHVTLFYTQHKSSVSFVPHMVHLLPVDQKWLDRLKEKEWPTNQLPMFTMDADRLFSALIRQYLFMSLYRGFVESLASENASRLASMQRAERNIEDRLGELQNEYHQQRQVSITSELLDIVGGYEALAAED